jgi:serine/threonine-protein kinase
VLEGSVRKSGTRLRITVQLVNATDGYHLWSERYDREMQDIFDVQDEITLAVVDVLKLKLLGKEKEELLKRHTDNAEAYQLYLHGRFFFFKRTPEGINKAIEYFEQAIELDSEYALAFAGLADCRTFLGFYEINSPGELVESIREEAYKALEIDATLAEAHTAVAIFKCMYEWDFRGSQKEFESAIKLNPKYALAHHFNGAPLLALGLNDLAIEAVRRAIELDPFTAIYNAAFGWWLYLSGRFEEAIEQSLKTIDIAPNHFFAHWVLGVTYGEQCRYEEALTSLQKAATLTGGNQHIKGDLGRVQAQSGHREEALRLLDELIGLPGERYVSPVNVAKILVGLGERDRVFEYLEKAFEERAVRLPFLIVDPVLAKYRDDPRFEDLVRRVRLPQ